MVPFFEYVLLSCLPSLFRASSGGLFRASSWRLLASSWPLLASFWLFARLSKISKIQACRDVIFFIKHCVSSSFSPNSGFLAFRGLFVSIFLLSGLFRASSGLFLASSGLFLASSGPLPGLFLVFSWILASSPSSTAQGHRRSRFSFVRGPGQQSLEIGEHRRLSRHGRNRHSEHLLISRCRED